jgi:hypothetical protein
MGREALLRFPRIVLESKGSENSRRQREQVKATMARFSPTVVD